MEIYKSIKGEVQFEHVIKKSRFICSLKQVNTPDEAKDYINQIKSIHKDATHNCSAFIVGINEKADDDGEPAQSAGLPMLDVLKHHNLNYIVAVVTRYFGGIMLGKGGLVRAYSKSVSETLNTCPIYDIYPGVRVEISFNYSLTKILDHTFKTNDYEVLKKEFGNKVIYSLNIKDDDLDNFKKLVLGIDHTIDISLKENVFIVEEEKNVK